MTDEHAENRPEPAADEQHGAPEVPLSPTAEFPRRSFLVRASAAIIGGIVAVVPVVIGTLFFLDPLIRRRGTAADAGNGGSEDASKDAEGYIRLDVKVDSLPENGTPQLVTVYDDKIDAWNKFLDQPIGSVFLRRTEGDKVVAFSSICPHLGCAVDYRSAQTDFFCPCHTSSFDLNGEKKNQIPPRGMDELQTRVDDEQTIWVKYERFRAATPEKTPV